MEPDRLLRLVAEMKLSDRSCLQFEVVDDEGANVDGLWTLFSPILMTLLLLRVSGVAPLGR